MVDAQCGFYAICKRRRISNNQDPLGNKNEWFLATLSYCIRVLRKHVRIHLSSFILIWWRAIACTTFITQNSCPSFITPSVTLTCHVITNNAVYTMSWALLKTLWSVPSFYTFWWYKQKTLLNFIKLCREHFFDLKNNIKILRKSNLTLS